MRKFKQFIENQEVLSLPSIPNGMIRLTHFTKSDPNQIVNSGLRIKNLINSTTDAHSTNEQVLETIKTGFVGSFNRSDFGDSVILIDIPNEYHRILNSPKNSIDLMPKTQIIGCVNRQNMKFTRNLNYDPFKMKRPSVNMNSRFSRTTKPTSVVDPLLTKPDYPSDLVF